MPGILRTCIRLLVLIVVTLGQGVAAELSRECSAYYLVPLPTEAERGPVPKEFPGCASYRSYRGVGRSVDYVEARTCAWQERLAQQAGLAQASREPIAWLVGGSLILADIYYNGAAVKRDIPLAMRLACESEAGMMNLAKEEIAKRDGTPRSRDGLEFCDYAFSTVQMNFCSEYSSTVEDDRRRRYFDSLKPSMTPAQRAAFEKLLSAESAYVEGHAAEVDQEGTIRAIRTISSRDVLKDIFRTEIIHFEGKKWPARSAQEIAMADRWLRREYEKKLGQLRVHTEEEIDHGAVAAEHFAGVEKAWENYRDAWVAFAKLRYPAAVASIRAEITLDRYRLVKSIE